MDLKSCMATVFILFLLLAVPAFSKAEEVYDIDYRGPETHTHRPPPNRPGSKSNGGRHGNFRKHLHFKRQQLRSAIKKEKKLNG